MSSPARRLRPTAHPTPVPLMLGGSEPADEAPVIFVDIPDVVVEVSDIQLTPVFDLSPLPTESDSDQPLPPSPPAPEPVSPILTTPPDGFGSGDDLWRAVHTLDQRICELITAVRIIGAQQQWTTDTFVALKQDFDQMMGSFTGKNPLAMLGAILKGKM